MPVARWALISILGFGCVVLMMATVRGKTSVASFFELRKSRDILMASNMKLAEENRKLSAEIEKIQGSASYARRLLKDKYHVLEPSEKIVFFDDEELK